MANAEEAKSKLAPRPLDTGPLVKAQPPASNSGSVERSQAADANVEEEGGGSSSSSSSRTGQSRENGVGSSSGRSGPAVVTATTNTTTTATNTSSSGDERSSSGAAGSKGDRGENSALFASGANTDDDVEDEFVPRLRHHHRQRRRLASCRTCHGVTVDGQNDEAECSSLVSSSSEKGGHRKENDSTDDTTACDSAVRDAANSRKSHSVSKSISIDMFSPLPSVAASPPTVCNNAERKERKIPEECSTKSFSSFGISLSADDESRLNSSATACKKPPGIAEEASTTPEPAAKNKATKRDTAAGGAGSGPAESLSTTAGNERGSTSSSCSDEGYAGSASSNDNFGTEQSTCSSPSISSSEGGGENNTLANKKSACTLVSASRNKGITGPPREKRAPRSNSGGSFASSSSSSSELADFSSGVSGACAEGGPFAFHSFSGSSSPRSSYADRSSDESEEGNDRTQKKPQEAKWAAAKRTAKPAKRSHSSHHKKRQSPASTNTCLKTYVVDSSTVETTSASSTKPNKGVKRPHRAISSAATSNKEQSDCGAISSLVPSVSSTLQDETSLLDQSFKKKMMRAAQRKAQMQHHHKLAQSFQSALKQNSPQDPSIATSSSVASAPLPLLSTSSSQKRPPPSMMGISHTTACLALSEKASFKRTKLPPNTKPPIYGLRCDTMALCLSYLEPPEVHSVLMMPLSKEWRATFTMPQDLWRVICLSEPFYAKFEGGDDPFGDESDDSASSFPTCTDLQVRHIFGRYCLLYTSFVRCMKYLARIKDDAINGRSPSSFDDGGFLARIHERSPSTVGEGCGMANLPFNANSSLKNFLAKARGVVRKNRRQRDGSPVSDGNGADESSNSSSRASSADSNDADSGSANQAYASMPIGVSDSSVESLSKSSKRKKGSKKAKYGHSKLTENLLGPSKTPGKVGHVDLPWSCAIYSIVNWMVAFADVEGIQIMCLKVLPFLLEDEYQRTTAQRAGLTDIVLRGMVMFPDSSELHTTAFHTLVLLARPLGGKEGMLFHSAMVNASGIFNIGSSSGKNGIAVMLDSMRRFESDEVLQAMSCWSMVNIALIPSQKTMLVKLGGISVAANAMMQHPYNAEVQFRALFALINLVIPSESLSEGTAEAVQAHLGEVNNTTEKEMLDENVGQIANLVVVAMKNFCSSEAILNRACLVLHNLSLNEEYHTTLLWTPNCYQMLEWCMGNYRHDDVLQQSAGGTLQRLQTTLANDNELRLRFAASIRAQQQSSLEQARREAMYLQDQQQQEEQQHQMQLSFGP